MSSYFKRFSKDRTNLGFLEALIITIIVCIIFPVCWVGEKIAIGAERNELGNFLMGLFVLGGSGIMLLAASLGLCIFL